MLLNVDLEHLAIETQTTINNVNKIKNKNESGKYFWYNKLENIHRSYFMAESLADEICAWIENKKEPVKKISALLIYQLDDSPM